MMYCQRPGIAELCARLSARSTALDDPRQNPVALWPREQLNWIADAGVLRGFESLENGGTGWSDVEQLQSYLDLGAACLTSAFILTQYVGAIKRLFLELGTSLILQLHKHCWLVNSSLPWRSRILPLADSI